MSHDLSTPSRPQPGVREHTSGHAFPSIRCSSLTARLHPALQRHSVASFLPPGECGAGWKQPAREGLWQEISRRVSGDNQPQMDKRWGEKHLEIFYSSFSLFYSAICFFSKDTYYNSKEVKLRFMNAMHSIAKVTGKAVATAFDLSKFKTACDLGGKEITKRCKSVFLTKKKNIFSYMYYLFICLPRMHWCHGL